MNAYYFRRDKIAVLGAIKAQLPFSEGKVKELKILKLDDIYLFHLGKFMYLFQNNLLPCPFGNLILRTNQVHNYNTRSSNMSLSV